MPPLVRAVDWLGVGVDLACVGIGHVVASDATGTHEPLRLDQGGGEILQGHHRAFAVSGVETRVGELAMAILIGPASSVVRLPAAAVSAWRPAMAPTDAITGSG